MGDRVALVALATATAIGVLGCGGAKSNHRYTVKQVQDAFASQGIHLRQIHLHKNPAVMQVRLQPPVLLRYGSSTNYVEVAVVGSERDTAEFFGAPNGSPRPRVTHHGDLIVLYNADHSAAVASALAELH